MGTGDWVLRYSAFRIRTPHSINYVHRFSICEWQSAENRPLRGGILRISSRNCNSFPDPARTTVQPPPKSPSPPGEGRGEGGTSLTSVDTKRPAPRTKPLAGEGSVRGPLTVPHSEFPSSIPIPRSAGREDQVRAEHLEEIPGPIFACASRPARHANLAAIGGADQSRRLPDWSRISVEK